MERKNFILKSYLTKTTLIAFIKAVTGWPWAKPASSKDSRVITDVSSMSPIHMDTWAMTSSALTRQMLPLSLFLTPASNFISPPVIFSYYYLNYVIYTDEAQD